MTQGPYFVYILSNSANTVLYTGQTHDLLQLVVEHRQLSVQGFTKRYRVIKLVYYEVADGREGALFREKQIKGYSREHKALLVQSMNPMWEDLFDKLS